MKIVKKSAVVLAVAGIVSLGILHYNHTTPVAVLQSSPTSDTSSTPIQPDTQSPQQTEGGVTAQTNTQSVQTGDTPTAPTSTTAPQQTPEVTPTPTPAPTLVSKTECEVTTVVDPHDISGALYTINTYSDGSVTVLQGGSIDMGNPTPACPDNQAPVSQPSNQ